jgi:F-type H+-transporting ATPase subunit a
MVNYLYSPLEQFSILEQFTFFIRLKIIGLTLLLDSSITLFLIENLNNFILFLSTSLLFLYYLNRKLALANSIFLLIYNFLFGILEQQVKNENYVNKYYILVVTVFFFILVNNIFGMIPYSFVSTAQLGQNFFLSSSLVIFFTQLGFFFLKTKFFNIFVPSAPILMLPFLIIIELISYIARAFSLAIRLFANLMSGHTLLFILCAFNSVILSTNFFGFVVATVLIFLIFGLELIIAFMQAYVFTVLISVYLKDSTVEAHH